MDEQKGYHIRYSLIRQHPRVRMLATHRDAHIYVFPHWVMDFVKENERMESVGEDVIGWWAKAGWQAGLAEKLGLKNVFQAEVPRDENQTPKEGSPAPRAGESEPPSAKVGEACRVVNVGTVDQEIGERVKAPVQTDRLKMPPFLAYVHPSGPDAPLIRRVDTAQLLLSVSLQLARLPSVEEAGSEASPFAHAKKVAYPEGVRPRTTITRQDSLVAENTTVAEKTSIKESVVGANCQIHEGARLIQCLLMDGVVVGKNCKLTRCILGKRSEIGEGSVLTKCEVQETCLSSQRVSSRRRTCTNSFGGAAATVWQIKTNNCNS